MTDEINSEGQKFNNIEYLERMLEQAVAANDGSTAQGLRTRLEEIRTAEAQREAAKVPAEAIDEPVTPTDGGSEPAASVEEPDTGAAPPTAPDPVFAEVKAKPGPVGVDPFDLYDILDNKDYDLLKGNNIENVPQMLNFLKVHKTPLDSLTSIKGVGSSRAQRILMALLTAGVDIENDG